MRVGLRTAASEDGRLSDKDVDTMSEAISPLAVVSPSARIADDVQIGPFCHVGPEVTIGAGCCLDSHVTITGKTTIGERNRFFPNAVIGCEPQDLGYRGNNTSVVIGDENIFREGVTVHRGADKEDGVTRIGNRNYLMANAHVAHNCHVFNNVILCNGVLLGGHVHVQDYAIVSGNSVVHHFATLGTSSFVSGGCRAPFDIPPYMLAAGSDDPQIITVNLVGMQRRGISRETIGTIKQVFKLLFREHKRPDDVRALIEEELDGVFPIEISNLLTFVEASRRGKNGRAREALRTASPGDQGKEAARRAA
jgi:UDP-N-acetylglucosamine acyltransferase